MKLPIGWAEAQPTGIPSDVGTPEDEWESIPSPRQPRQEIKCWVRGARYVRICEVHPYPSAKKTHHPYDLHFGLIDDLDKDKIKKQGPDLAKLELEAKILMRKGGY